VSRGEAKIDKIFSERELVAHKWSSFGDNSIRAGAIASIHDEAVMANDNNSSMISSRRTYKHNVGRGDTQTEPACERQ
jgi:hypothetical protein